MSHDSEYDRLINNKWKAAGLLSNPERAPSDKLAISGCKRLYRKAFGKAFKGKWEIVRRKNQYTWWKPRTGGTIICVNPNRPDFWGRTGWPDMVHLISHMAHSQLRPNERPHSVNQLELEKELTNYALSDSFSKFL